MLQSMGSQRVGHDLAIEQQDFIKEIPICRLKLGCEPNGLMPFGLLCVFVCSFFPKLDKPDTVIFVELNSLLLGIRTNVLSIYHQCVSFFMFVFFFLIFISVDLKNNFVGNQLCLSGNYYKCGPSWRRKRSKNC